MSNNINPGLITIYYLYLRNLGFILDLIRSKLKIITKIRNNKFVHKNLLRQKNIRNEYEDKEECVECTVLYEPVEERTADVIFIHGLHGSLTKTWKQRQTKLGLMQLAGTNSSKLREFTNCWPREWLPFDCPNARIIAINYTTDPYLWRPIWKKPMKRFL